MENVDSSDPDLYLVGIGFSRKDFDIRLPEDYEQVALAGVLQIIGHMEISVHSGLQNR